MLQRARVLAFPNVKYRLHETSEHINVTLMFIKRRCIEGTEGVRINEEVVEKRFGLPFCPEFIKNRSFFLMKIGYGSRSVQAKSQLILETCLWKSLMILMRDNIFKLRYYT